MAAHDTECHHGVVLTVPCADCAAELGPLPDLLPAQFAKAKAMEYDLTPEKYAGNLKMQMILSVVHEELKKATAKHGPMRTPHEAFGVIYEEFIIEFGKAMHANDQDEMRKEMIQVAAMACRFLYDIGFPADAR